MSYTETETTTNDVIRVDLCSDATAYYGRQWEEAEGTRLLPMEYPCVIHDKQCELTCLYRRY